MHTSLTDKGMCLGEGTCMYFTQAGKSDCNKKCQEASQILQICQMNGDNLCPNNSAALQIIAGVSFKTSLLEKKLLFKK